MEEVAGMELSGKVAVVTGATSGIGQRIAQRFAELGASVAVAGRNMDAAQDIVADIEERGGRAIPLKMDVSDKASVDQGFDRVVNELGPVDILVSNAGIQLVNPIDEYDFADWKKMMSVHLDGAFLTTQAALRSMYEHDRGGNVIYVGSAHSHMASINKCAYVTAKHGLLGLARVLAKEGGKRKVRSFVISPGLVMTPLIEKQLPDLARQLGMSEEEALKKELLKNTVDQEPGSVDEVADLAVFLARQETAALSGQSFNCGHGIHMQ
ncbi:3-hydroxybutyrate dehydrogenase [Halomonas sp. HK25]|uniref:3-hydroxybutyrate dehydrogenase n=1 Tax=Halomonas sp. HK25 TaxID=3394321 RepID=UPI0039FB9028